MALATGLVVLDIVSQDRRLAPFRSQREVNVLDESRGDSPDPVDHPTSSLMLDLPGTGKEPIDFAALPRIASQHAMISDVRDRDGTWVHQHAYLAHHDGRYWAMTRRDHQRQVSVMIGGDQAFDDWKIRPLASYNGTGRPEEPYWYVLPDGKNIVGLIRDNGGSKRLLRTFSTDNARSWSPITKTDFPDATSKFFVHRTSRGYYAMVSNANPRRRDPLTLAISRDGLVYRHLFYLVGGRHVDYPHIIEHNDHLLIAFSGAKQTMEVVKVSLDDIDTLIEP